MTTLFVSPVERTSAIGRDRQVYTFVDEVTKELKVGRSMRKTRADGAGVVLSFIPDYANLRYKTNLWEEVDNPYFESTSVTEALAKQKKITKQTLLEIKHKVPTGTYSSQMTGGGIFRMTNSKEKVPTNFIENFAITLFDRANRFDDTTPRGELAILMLKNHPRVAPSKDEINSSIHWFYISQENEEIQEQMRRQDLIDSATFEKVLLLKNSDKLIAYKVTSLCLYSDGVPAITGNANEELVRNQLNAFLSSGKNQVNNVNKFLSVIELLKSNKDLFEIKYLVQQALNTNVIKLNGGYIYWVSQQSKPNLYKWNDLEKLENYLMQEMLTQTTDDVSNGYADFVKELIKKGVVIE